MKLILDYNKIKVYITNNSIIIKEIIVTSKLLWDVWSGRGVIERAESNIVRLEVELDY